MQCVNRLLVLASIASCSAAQTVVFDQPLVANGVSRPSQLWMDPSKQNDLDSDAIAYEDFRVDRDTAITRVRFWGEVMPAQGFLIEFHNQDPNTIASQPDLFRPQSEPLLEEVHPQPALVASGGGWVQYEVVLTEPVPVTAGTRYFVAVIGLEPIPWADWRWAQGGAVNTGTFYWSRGAHTYYQMPENRALTLYSADAPCVADLSGDGVLDFFDVSAFLAGYNAQSPGTDLVAPFGSWDFFDIAAFLAAFSAGCP